MGAVASIPETLVDALDAIAKLLIAVEKAMVHLAEMFPELLTAFLGILENIVQLVAIMVRGGKFVVFALPAIAIFYTVSYVIEELGL